MSVFTRLCWFCWAISLGLITPGLAQQPRLPEIDFDRRNEATYMDSLLTIGRQNLYASERLPRSRRNDTLKLEALRYLTIVFKQTHSPLRDSSYLYAQRLFVLATTYRNAMYAVRALMQQEYYVRVVQGDYPKALDINRQATRLCASLKPGESPLWQVKLNMGTIYFLLRDYPEALLNFQASVALLPHYTLLAKRSQQLLISDATTRIGELYEAQGRFADAQRQYEASLRIAVETRSRINIAYANEQLGDFYLNQQQVQGAKLYYDQALLVWTKLNDEGGKAAVWARLSEVYGLLNKPDSAIIVGEKALEIARRRVYNRTRQMSTLSLYRAYRRAGQPARALAMYEEYQVLRDSLARRKQVDETQAMQKRYDIEKVQLEAERRQLIGRQEFAELRRASELARLQAETERWQLAANGRATQLRQRLVNERTKAEADRNRLEQQASITNLNLDIKQQKALRAVLLVGLLLTLGFVGLITRNNWLINRQKREINTLNTSLEDKVSQRTAELERANEQLRAKNREIADALLRGQTQERKRVAADLHDNLGGLVAAIKISLGALDPGRMSEREQLVYTNLLAMTKEAYAEIRHLSHNLQPEELEKQGLAEALIRLTDKLNLTQRIHFSLDCAELPALDKHTDFQLYSICLELCNNILKHSDATIASIAFQRTDNELIMRVWDNGRGIGDWQTTGIGLRNLRDRAATMQSRMDVKTGEGQGTAFSFLLPYQQAIPAGNPVADV